MVADDNQQQWAIRDYVRLVNNDNDSGIAHKTIAANNFEMKLGLISIVQLNQFGGSPSEYPNVHLTTFLEMCDTMEINGVTKDASIYFHSP